MNKSEKLSRKTRRMIAKNLIILAVLAVVAFASVISWFTQNTTATADGIFVQTQVSDGLEFYIMPPSDDDQYSAINDRLVANSIWNVAHSPETQRRTTWHTSSDGEVTFDFSDQEFKFMEGLFLCDITGDGKTFSIPKLMQYKNTAYVDTSQSFDTPIPNDEYMSFDIYFRSENENDVKLLADSAITPKTTFSNDYYENVSDNPDEVKSAAIGAVRMAVYEDNDLHLLWIPAPKIYYNGVEDKLYTNLTDYSNHGSAYYNGSDIALRTGEGTDDHSYYSPLKSRTTISHNTNGVVAGGTLGSDTGSILTMDNNGNDGYYYGWVRINLWIEGEDAEARLAFVGGNFNMSLKFEMIHSDQ